jgi:hypothetical protein
MKQITAFVLTLFFIILLALPVSWITNLGSEPEESIVEARTMAAFVPVSNPNLSRAISFMQEGNYRAALNIIFSLYTSASFVNNFEFATNDQFPFRLPIIQFSKALDRLIINMTYSLIKDTIIPADATSDIYYDSSNNQLVFAPTLFTNSTIANIDERIQNYQEIMNAHPGKNIYIYYHQTLHNSEFHPLADVFSDADNGQGIAYFEKIYPTTSHWKNSC